MSTTLRELDHRSDTRSTVRVLWDSAERVCVLEHANAEGEDARRCVVPSDRVMDAFAHPFMYLDSCEEYVVVDELLATSGS
jgi:hypothetical protein